MRRASPGGGSAAGVAVALGASLCAMAARFAADRLVDAANLVARADGLGSSALFLAEADGPAFAAVLLARRAPTDEGALWRALLRAVDVPLALAEAGAEVTELAAHLIGVSSNDLRGDARTALLLAAAGTDAAVGLVADNLVHLPHVGDEAALRRVRAGDASRRAAAAVAGVSLGGPGAGPVEGRAAGAP